MADWPSQEVAVVPSASSEQSRAADAAAAPAPGRGRLSVITVTWVGSFVVTAAVLLVRNAYLFTTRIYENQDFAANSIAILQAKHLALLTGHYSKMGFYHPGPALLYVEAAGESFFRDLLHVVPTPWNGQLLAILLLNAALVAATLTVIARHSRSRVAVLACLAVLLLFAALHPLTVNSGWMPYVYFAPFLLLLASGASVASGETAFLPLLALSAGLCINGQAEFLLFAPAAVVVALAGLVAASRRDLRAMVRSGSRHWAVALGVMGLLLLPIALNTFLHWPGEFGKYLAYRHDYSSQIDHSLAVSAAYTLRYWWPGIPSASAAKGGAIVAGLLFALALLIARGCRVPGVRRFLLWSLAMAGLTTVLFAGYAYSSITDSDIATQYYLGYFYWAAPLLVLLVAVTGAAIYPGWRWPTLQERWQPAAVALAAAVAGAAVLAALVPQVSDNRHDPPGKYYGLPDMPQVMGRIEAAAAGRVIVVKETHNAWIDMVGVVAYADRTGRRACVAGARWGVLFRRQSVCTARQLRTGQAFWFTPHGVQPPTGTRVVARFHDSSISEQPTAANFMGRFPRGQVGSVP